MPYLFKRYYSFRNIGFFVGEGGVIFLVLIGVNLLFKGPVIFLLELPECIGQALLVVFTFQLCLYFFDLYELRENIPLPVTATRITKAFGVGCIVLAGFYYVLPTVVIPTKIFWTSYFIIYLLVLIWRAAYFSLLQRRIFTQALAILGTGKLAEDITREIEERYDTPYRIVAYIGSEKPLYNPGGRPVIHQLGDLESIMVSSKIDRIVVALDDRRGETPTQKLLSYKLQGVNIEQGVNFYEKLAAKILVEKVDPSWIFFSEGFTISKIHRFGKRSSDILLSLFLLVLTLPVMIISAAIIKIESKGPVFYRQERVGKGRVTFKVLKFRSMVEDAEKNGAVWATANDSRVTRYGEFMRKTRIDELPQLINVLKGEMSLVGPRPERPVFVEKLKELIPYYDIRHDIRPGVTGWAQVCYRYGASEEDALRKLEYDLYYMKHMSIPLDLLVIFKTVKTVLFARGGQ